MSNLNLLTSLFFTESKLGELTNKKKCEDKSNTKINIFMWYMIITNVVLIFYTNFPFKSSTYDTKDYFLFSQRLTSYSYNGLCILVTIIISILINFDLDNKFGKEKLRIIRFFIRMFFITKINLDYMILSSLTQINDKTALTLQLNCLYFYVMIFNYSLFFFLARNKKIFMIPTSQLMIHCLLLMLFSIILCFLLNLDTYINGNNSDIINAITNFVIYEIIKIIYYFSLFFINLSNTPDKILLREYNRNILILEGTTKFLINNLENSKTTGLIFIKNYEKIISNNYFFDNLLDNLHINRDSASKTQK